MLVNNPLATRAEPYTKQLGGCTGKGFMPGVSGNPSGRAKGRRTFTVIATELLDQGLDDKDGEPITMDDLVRAVILKAVEGHPVALKELLARLDPAPNHNININNNVNTTSKEMFEFMEKCKASTAMLEEEEILQLQSGSDDNPTTDS